VLLALFNLPVARPAEALSGPKKTVLVLYGERLSIPAMRLTEQGLSAGLSRAAGWNLEIYSEYLDLTRFPTAEYGDDLVRYLRVRYGSRKPDVLITVVNNALQFALEHRDELFPGVPIVFANVDHREVEGKAMPPNVSGLWMAWDYQRTLELALQVQPKTREVVCVAGTGLEEQAWNTEARKVLGSFATRVRTRWLDKLPLQAMLDEVARLPLDSVVLYIPMLRDGIGESVSPFEVARQLAEASRVPVYGLSRPQLEQGIIGGALLDFSAIGSKTAALAFRVLAGEKLPALSEPDPATNPMLINWPALKKWHVSNSGIPGEATILYREPGLWERHPRLIVATIAVLILQSLLIVVLIIQRARLKRAEGLLRESEERMSLAAEAATLGMWVWDVARDDLWMTDKGRALFGLAPDSRPDFETLISRVHPEDRAPRAAAIKRALKNQAEYAIEYRVLLPDGTLRWINARGHCKGTRLFGVSMEVTANKQAQDALRESEARFRIMADTAPVMIWMSGADKLCTFFNKGWLDFTGRSLDRELGNGWAEGVHREDFDRCFETYVNSFDARKLFTMEYRLRRNDGVYRWVLDNGAPRYASDGAFLGYIGSCIDITERKQAELQLRQQRDELAHLSRVTTLGDLATTLAHELNQPLGAIHSNAEAAEILLQKNPPDLNEMRAILNDIRQDGWRAGEIIRRMRSLLRRHQLKMERIEVQGLIEALGGLLQAVVISRKARLRILAAPKLPPVWGDAVQLQQVLLNLILNALEVMIDYPAAEREVVVRAVPSGTWGVEITVIDQGPGFTKEKLARLFEPFFTTKKDGMGFGLAICQKIIEAHGGQLSAENNSDQGATIRFTLPKSLHEQEESA
jgi:PAS domain S-box-containing protein